MSTERRPEPVAFRVPSLCDACHEVASRLAMVERKPTNWSVSCWMGQHAECTTVVQLASGCVCPHHIPKGEDG